MPVVLVLVLVLVIELGESFLRIIEKRRRTGMWFRPWPRFMPPLRGSGCHFRGGLGCYRHAGPTGLRNQRRRGAEAQQQEVVQVVQDIASGTQMCSLRSLEENLVSRKRPAVVIDHTLNILPNRAP